MREIKFRLRIGNKIVGYEKWDIGTGDNAGWFYCKNPNGKYPDNVWRRDYIYHTEKDQFIGSHDKNGKEVYEGDILRMLSRNLSQVYFRDSGFCVDVGGLIIGFHPDYLGRYKTVEVIGNIYENPELLKGKSE